MPVRRSIVKLRRDGVRQRYHVVTSQPKQVKTLKKEKSIYEPKYDGTRLNVINEGKKLTLVNRRNVVKNEIYPELFGLDKNIKGDAILDGELVVMDKDHPFGNFEKLSMRDRLKDVSKIKKRSKSMPVTFVAFDILSKDGKNLKDKPLIERKKILDNSITQNSFIKEIEFSNKPEELLKKVKSKSGEGIIRKDINGKYQEGHTRNWEKLKFSKENDVAIIGFTPGTGKRKRYFGALKMAVNTKQGMKSVGNVGTGFADSDLKEITGKLKRNEKLVARIKYRKKGSGGNYIEPSFKTLRTDISQKQTHS